MAKIVLTNPSVTINSVDLSDHISNITLDTKYDVLETTGFGAAGAKTRVGGLVDNSVSIDFIQDFAAASVEVTINPVGASLVGTVTTLVVQPVAGTASTTNPKYTFTALISDWTPLKGAVGQLSTATVTWPISGAITKANS